MTSDGLHQTAQIWDAKTGDAKAELRGHQNDVEVAVFATIASHAAIRTLAGLPV